MAELALVHNDVPAQEQAATFDDFWLLYPRRVAKRDAQKAWSRMTADEQAAAVVAMVDWRRVWRGKDPQYIPHPATWLNGARWEDELPASNEASHASHVQAEPEKPFVKSVMPEHVKALLAKLRGKA